MGTINIGSSGSIIATNYKNKTGKVVINSQDSGLINMVQGNIDVSSSNLKVPSGYISVQGKTIYHRGKIKANGEYGGKVQLLSKDMLALDGVIEANGSSSEGVK